MWRRNSVLSACSSTTRRLPRAWRALFIAFFIAKYKLIDAKIKKAEEKNNLSGNYSYYYYYYYYYANSVHFISFENFFKNEEEKNKRTLSLLFCCWMVGDDVSHHISISRLRHRKWSFWCASWLLVVALVVVVVDTTRRPNTSCFRRRQIPSQVAPRANHGRGRCWHRLFRDSVSARTTVAIGGKRRCPASDIRPLSSPSIERTTLSTQRCQRRLALHVHRTPCISFFSYSTLCSLLSFA